MELVHCECRRDQCEWSLHNMIIILIMHAIVVVVVFVVVLVVLVDVVICDKCTCL